MSDSPSLPPGGDAFVAACLDAPDDAQVRLVFADWLDDRGDVRGKYLRALVRAWGVAAALPAPRSAVKGKGRVRPAAPPLPVARGRMRESVGDAWRAWRAWACCCLRFCPRAGGLVWSLAGPAARLAVASAELYSCDLLGRDRLTAARSAVPLAAAPTHGWESAVVVAPAVAEMDAACLASRGTSFAVGAFGAYWADFRWPAELAAVLPAAIPEFTDP